MYKGDFQIVDPICIITNKWGNIQYSNIDMDTAYTYLQGVEMSRETIELPVKYTGEDYCVCIDRLYKDNQHYYITIIAPRYYKCKTCTKALEDALTGLYNRNYWERFTKGLIDHLKVGDFSLILIDIDNLKEINDNLGHLAGDQAIKIVGESIKNSIRKDDIGIRYGGDEFIVLLPDVDVDVANKVIERIHEELFRRSKEEDIDVYISAGVAYDGSLDDIQKTISMADRNLYMEKKVKKEHKQEKIQTLKELRSAMEKLRDELNGKCIQSDHDMSSQEVLGLSQKLDKMIIQ